MTDEAWDVHEAALIADAYRAHEHYDKTIIALSGGALGVSLVFALDIVGANAGHGWLWLLGAWALWTLSLSATLLSYYTSFQANWHEIQDCRRLRRGEAVRAIVPGGWWNTWTLRLNPAAGVLFVLGVVSEAVFVFVNVRGKP